MLEFHGLTSTSQGIAWKRSECSPGEHRHHLDGDQELQPLQVNQASPPREPGIHLQVSQASPAKVSQVSPPGEPPLHLQVSPASPPGEHRFTCQVAGFTIRIPSIHGSSASPPRKTRFAQDRAQIQRENPDPDHQQPSRIKAGAANLAHTETPGPRDPVHGQAPVSGPQSAGPPGVEAKRTAAQNAPVTRRRANRTTRLTLLSLSLVTW